VRACVRACVCVCVCVCVSVCAPFRASSEDFLLEFSHQISHPRSDLQIQNKIIRSLEDEKDYLGSANKVVILLPSTHRARLRSLIS